MPLREFLRGGRATKVAASLRALGEGGWWTQERMYEAKLPGVEDNLCQVCHGQVGTLYHRCCGCPGLNNLVAVSTGHKEILHMARSALHCNKPLFQNGVPLLDKPSKPPEFVARWCGGRVIDYPFFTGNVFSDGSVRGGCRKGDERSGWAAVRVNDQGEVEFGLRFAASVWVES